MIDRGSFTKGLLGSFAASISAPHTFANNLADASDGPFDCDIAVVGGGVSGTYTAWRLMTSDPRPVRHSLGARESAAPLDVILFEGSDRIGGRLLSARSPDTQQQGIVCELGGMRVVETQRHVLKLIGDLGLSSELIQLKSKLGFAFLRGRRIPKSSFTNPDDIPYHLLLNERARVRSDGADSLVEWAVRDVVVSAKSADNQKLVGTKLYDALKYADFQGIPLYQWGFKNLLEQRLSVEALALSKALFGFDSFFGNANAFDLAVKTLDLGPNTAFRLIKDGFEKVPWTLQERFEAAGGKVKLGERLEGFKRIAGGVQLHFQSGYTIRARAVVLAMPRHALQRVLGAWPMPRANGRSVLDSVEPISLFKMFLQYSHAWWLPKLPSLAQGVNCAGKSYSDTPIRQCWYWHSADCDSPRKNVIMVYCDTTSVQYWEQWRQPSRTIPACPTTKDELAANWSCSAPPREMVAAVHQQLLLMHGIDGANIELPRAAFKDWNDEPFGGAVHLWKKGVKSWELAERMLQPIPDVPCYVCGEAYSMKQTWVEGALESADRLLHKLNGVAPPL